MKRTETAMRAQEMIEQGVSEKDAAAILGYKTVQGMRSAIRAIKKREDAAETPDAPQKMEEKRREEAAEPAETEDKKIGVEPIAWLSSFGLYRDFNDSEYVIRQNYRKKGEIRISARPFLNELGELKALLGLIEAEMKRREMKKRDWEKKKDVWGD